MNAGTPTLPEQAAALMTAACPDARAGLAQPLFLAVSRLTPLVNVDLLVTDDQGRLLMTWRSDTFYGPGWHVPGGILRFKESAAARIAAVAKTELGAQIDAASHPWRVMELIATERDLRGHFITLSYPCRLLTGLPEDRRSAREPEHGQWAWFDKLPTQTITQHRFYESWFTEHKTC